MWKCGKVWGCEHKHGMHVCMCVSLVVLAKRLSVGMRVEKVWWKGGC